MLHNPDALKAMLRLAIWVAGLSFVLLFIVPGDSPEFVVTACSLAMGLTVMGLVVLVTRRTR
jgi:hypothetical protein